MRVGSRDGTNISATAKSAIGGAENFEVSRPPSTAPRRKVAGHDGRERHRTSTAAVAKRNSAIAPSTVAIEKCAMSGGEKTNRASARFAPPSENIRRAVVHSSHA